MVPRWACIQGVRKVKVKVEGHVIRALLWCHEMFTIQYLLTFCLSMHSLYEAPLRSPSCTSVRQLDVMSTSWNELLRHWRSGSFELVWSAFITEPNEDNIIQQLFWAAESRMAVFFSQFFNRRIFEQFKLRSPWRKWYVRSQIVLFDVLMTNFCLVQWYFSYEINLSYSLS